MDTRRGLYSYEALQSRLAENSFAVDGLVDYSGPGPAPGQPDPEDLYVLLQQAPARLRRRASRRDYLVPDEALEAFMEHCSKRVGDAYFRTPRSTIKAFVNLLAVLEQNPGAQLGRPARRVELAPDAQPGPASRCEEPDEASASETDDDARRPSRL